MVATAVGYAGGTTPNPTYEDLGDHSEAIRITFDPKVISYAELLREFFATHDTCGGPSSRQYRSAVFYHDDEQRRSAEEAKAAVKKATGSTPLTALEAAGRFTLAEDYHQKYRLRMEPALVRELTRYYPTREGFLGSTVVTKLNAWLARAGKRSDVERLLPELGLSEAGKQLLLGAWDR